MDERNEEFSRRVLDKVLSEALGSTSKPSLRQLYERKLEELGISDRIAAREVMGIEHTPLHQILDGTAKFPDALKMLKLASFLEIDVHEVMTLFVQNAPRAEVAKLESVGRATYIVKEFDLVQMKKAGVLKSITDFAAIERRLLTFLGLASIEDYTRDLAYALYSRTKRASSNKMLDFWTKSAYQYFVEVDNPNDYDREALKNLVPKIRPYTRDVENGLLTVVRALYSVGVTVIYQPYLPNTQVRGATFRINGKPCIALSDFRKSYATVWFALMHELNHVLFDLDSIATYHITGEPDLMLINEEQANDFARDYLFSNERMDFVKPFIHEHAIVARCAEEAQVHPSIIYGFYEYQTGNYQTPFKRHEPNVQAMLAKLNACSWDAESIKENALKIRKALDVTLR
ncbi:MAG: ImmA/IrrE family metallo-endopeptidase [Bacteroidetes bacterium]|nr:ImmA/IrrE family metallo-endopeptidase [Bacteroidota bacterium]